MYMNLVLIIKFLIEKNRHAYTHADGCHRDSDGVTPSALRNLRLRALHLKWKCDDVPP